MQWVLISLPSQYNQFKFIITDLRMYREQGEKRLKPDKIENTHLTFDNKKKENKGSNTKETA